MSSFFVEKKPTPSKTRQNLPPSATIQPISFWAPEQIQGAQTTWGFGRTQLCLEPMDRLVVFTLNPWIIRKPWEFDGFWWVGNQPIWLVLLVWGKRWFWDSKRGTTQGFGIPESVEGDSRIPNHPGPNSPLAETWNPQNKKFGRWCSEIQLTVIFWFHLFRFRGVLFCSGKEKEARRVGEIENWWSSRSSGGSEGQKLRSLNMSVW